jgi:hypothetical protein
MADVIAGGKEPGEPEGMNGATHPPRASNQLEQWLHRDGEALVGFRVGLRQALRDHGHLSGCGLDRDTSLYPSHDEEIMIFASDLLSLKRQGHTQFCGSFVRWPGCGHTNNDVKARRSSAISCQ